MTVREIYQDAILGKHHSLKLMIEFLVYKKKVVSFEDDRSVLNKYFLEKHKERLNKLLADYEEERNHV